ncbi:MAG: hypothetical protein WD333_02175 [Dehalococcoidia bacterium]
MDLTGVVVAGIAGTVVITTLMYSAPMMSMPRVDIAQLMGSMVVPLGGSAFAVGLMAHFVMGVIFAAIYAAVWASDSIPVTWWSGLIFGVVHSMVAAVGMWLMMPMNREVKAGRLESPLAAGPRGMVGMLTGHMFFGLVLALVYGVFI